MGREPREVRVVSRSTASVASEVSQILNEAGISDDVDDEVNLGDIGFDHFSVLQTVRRLEQAGASPFPTELIEFMNCVGDLRYYANTKLGHRP